MSVFFLHNCIITPFFFFHMQDSDRLWRLTPPAQKALAALLDDSSAAMSFSWSVIRNAPPMSPHGSPLCQATQTFQLAPLSREHLVDILEVWAQLKHLTLLAPTGNAYTV